MYLTNINAVLEKEEADQIFGLGVIQTKTFEYKKPTHVALIDVKQAYDKVNKKELLKSLEDLGIRKRLVTLTNMDLQQTQ